MHLVVQFSLFFGVLDVGKSANILALFPLHVKSHFNVYEKLLIGLAEKGHHVDVVSHFPQEKMLPRYNDLSIKGSIPILTNNLPIGIMGNGHIKDIKFMLLDAGVELCKVVFNTTVFQNLKISKKKYDVLIYEIFTTDCMIGFAHVLNIPTIGITSSVVLPWISERLGVPDNPSYISNFFAPYSSKMSFMERVSNTLLLMATKTAYNMMSLDGSNKVSQHFFGLTLPHLYDLINNISLVLVNSHFSMHQPRPFVPNCVEVGGLHLDKNKSLSKNFENVVTTDLNGIIYLSFGSMLQTESFDEEIIRNLFDALNQLPYKVIWKGVKENFPQTIRIPNNIEFHSWLPQLDILCHPNVKLFIGHGGLLGIQEAIYCGVPILGIPIFGDQEHTVKACESRGFALGVPFDKVTKDSVLRAAQTMLQNPRFKLNAEEASRIFRDRPMSPLDTAVYWVEYVVRYRGAPHLRSAGADLCWYQYYLIDVFVVLLGSFLLVTVCLYRLSFFVCNILMFRKSKKIKIN